MVCYGSGLRGGAGEGLESALRISIRQAHDGAGDAAAEELPIKGLANGLAGASSQREPMAMSAPAAMAAKRPCASSMGAGEIGVSEHRPPLEGVEDAVAHTVALAVVAGLARLGVGFGKGTDDFGGLSVAEPSSTAMTSALQPR